MSWTDERIATLRKMWEGGATASEIATELGGVSRNAVIGKAHRLGLKARPFPGQGQRQEKSPPRPRSRLHPHRGPRPNRAPMRAHGAPASAPEQTAAPRPAAPPARTDDTARRIGCLAFAADAQSFVRSAQDRLGRPGRVSAARPRRSAGADPACPAAPPRAGQAKPRDRGQDHPARSFGQGLPLADGPSGRA